MATFTVTNLFDSGTGSFRQAIFDANTQAGVDEIIFDTGGVPSTITLTSGALNIADSVNILGAGANLLTVSGNNTSRIFNINDGGSDILDVLISGLTLTDGYTTSSGAAIFNTDENLSLVDAVITGNTAFAHFSSDGFSGGGIFNDSGHLTIVNSAITNNTVEGGYSPYGGMSSGGGVFNDSGYVTIVNSKISNNTAEGGFSVNDSYRGRGGGVFNDSGDLTLVNSTITGNRSEGGNGSGGGGIFNDSGNVTITNSAISSNTAEGSYLQGGYSGNGSGGGIFNDSGNVTITNSTISSNAAKSPSSFYQGTGNTYGGGISGKVTVINSTISENKAEAGSPSQTVCFGKPGNSYGGGIWGSGEIFNSTITGNTAKGGIGCFFDDGIGVGSGIANTDTMTITSSIVAGNADGDDIYGGFTSGGNNLIGIDPLLSPLQNNGGSTETHALLPGSPAIDAGSNPLGLLTDQRGAGFNRTSGSQTDIGAFEVQQPPSTSVPEPSSMLGLIGLVVIGSGSLLRRKRQNKS
jgi:hypothetical protein